MNQRCVLSSSYFPPIAWFSLAMQAEKITLDIHEHYTKQTWRNRCRIAGANGPLDLIIPVKTLGNHTAMKDVKMDYSTNWQRVHWHAIRSSYGKSPFFEFYADRFAPLFQQKPEHLITWNENCLKVVLSSCKMKIETKVSEDYIEIPNEEPDYRTLISPRAEMPLTLVPTKEYIQVFQERHTFQQNLSILDLLFCVGPETVNFSKTGQ